MCSAFTHCRSACRSSMRLRANRMPHRWLALDAGHMPRTAARVRASAMRCRSPSAASISWCCRTRSSWRAIRTCTLAEVDRVLMPEGRVVILGFNARQPVGPAPAPGPHAPAAGRQGAAVPAAAGRLHRLLAPARLAAPAQLRGRGRALRRLPAGPRLRALARALCLDGPRRRPLVAGLRRGLHGGGGQARARHAPGGPGQARAQQGARQRRRWWPTSTTPASGTDTSNESDSGRRSRSTPTAPARATRAPAAGAPG